MTNQYPSLCFPVPVPFALGTGHYILGVTPGSEVTHPILKLAPQHWELPDKGTRGVMGAPADLQYLIPLFLQVLGPVHSEGQTNWKC